MKTAAGHCIPQIHRPVSASQFMDDLRAEENAYHHLEAPPESQGNFVNEPSLRSVLSDPLLQGAAFATEKLMRPPYFLTLL